MQYIKNMIDSLLNNWGVSHEIIIHLRLLILLVILILLSYLAFWITKKVVINYIYKIIRHTPVKWDDILADQHTFNGLAHIIPAVIVKVAAPVVFSDHSGFLPFVYKLTDSYLVIVGLILILSFLKVIEFSLSKTAAFREKPITSYFQLIRIILYLATGILILSILLAKSPLYFLSAFGAMTAILLLIFKDTILGLVASVQISSNDMVRVGDWIEMPKFNADGDVLAINLNTVKVQNFDRTITTIPTYYFISDSFKNWRGMVESGGRRIKRAIYINAQSIRFVDPDTRERYKKFNLLTEYINKRQKEIEEYNANNNIDTSILINGRRMTNIGVFRHYVENYLKNHPRISKEMTLMVRQLAIEDRGVPIEIYCFTNTTKWTEYESIQADVFDHVLSAAGFFDLEIFQQPSGKDISNAIDNLRRLAD